MKILIVEDNYQKNQNIINLLKKLEISDYTTEKYVSKVLQKILIMGNTYDLIITDLGLPRFIDRGIEDKKEGLKMLYDLSYKNINIPAIIYSKTEIHDEQLNYLNELEYPFIGQANDLESLEKMMIDFVFQTKISNYTKQIK